MSISCLAYRDEAQPCVADANMGRTNRDDLAQCALIFDRDHRSIPLLRLSAGENAAEQKRHDAYGQPDGEECEELGEHLKAHRKVQDGKVTEVLPRHGVVIVRSLNGTGSPPTPVHLPLTGNGRAPFLALDVPINAAISACGRPKHAVDLVQRSRRVTEIFTPVVEPVAVDMVYHQTIALAHDQAMQIDSLARDIRSHVITTQRRAPCGFVPPPPFYGSGILFGNKGMPPVAQRNCHAHAATACSEGGVALRGRFGGKSLATSFRPSTTGSLSRDSCHQRGMKFAVRQLLTVEGVNSSLSATAEVPPSATMI